MSRLYRDKKTASVLKEKVSLILSREISNPQIKTELITVTGVKVSKDLRVANIYVSIFISDEGERAKTFRALKKATSFIRSRIASLIRAKYTPELRFKEDNSLREGELMYRKVQGLGHELNELEDTGEDTREDTREDIREDKKKEVIKESEDEGSEDEGSEASKETNDLPRKKSS